MVGSRLEHGLATDEVETLSSLANQAAIATENARLQARLRELAVVAERERIAREMHDGLAQVLGYVNTKSQAIEELLAAGRTDEARRALRELAAAARSIYVDVREAILGLRSPVVPGVGLVARGRGLRGPLRRGRRRSRSASTPPSAARRLELAPDVEAQVFRIVQEALTNVRKHAGAHRAEVVFVDRRRRDSTSSSPTTAVAPGPPTDRPIGRTTDSGRCASGPTASGRPSIGRTRPRAAAASTSRSPRRPAGAGRRRDAGAT